MAKPFLTALIWTLLPLISYAQFGKKLRYSSVHIAATLNYYSPIEPYTFLSEYQTEDQNLILNFQTNNSGTFVIEDQEPIDVERAFVYNFPSQLVGFGMSMQILSDKSLFQELSITQLSIIKSTTVIDYRIRNINGDFATVLLEGEEQRTSIFGLRYEFGKYFGNKRSPVQFGLSAGVESTFYKFKMKPKSIRRFPVSANLTTLEISVIPILSIKFNKKITLDLKLLSNFLVADFETIIEDDPGKPNEAKSGTRNYNLPEIDLGASVVLRCKIKEAKKRKRR